MTQGKQQQPARFYGRQQIISAGLVGGPLAGAFMMLVNSRCTAKLSQRPRVAAWFLVLLAVHLAFGVVMGVMPDVPFLLIPYAICVVCTVILGVQWLQGADIAMLENSPEHKRYSDTRSAAVILLSLPLSVFIYAFLVDLTALIFCQHSCA